jgi:peptidoglycan/xylan/chitin deacetylase (PgdA/CDA1 family)
MCELNDRFLVLPLREAMAKLENGGLGDRMTVAITFDDAYVNFYEKAWPIIEDLKLPVSLFVPTGFVEGLCSPPVSAYHGAPMSWGSLRELAESRLVELGSHTWSHPDLRGMSDEQLDRELRCSKETIEDRTGSKISGFCYPRALWSARVAREVRLHYGYAVAGGGVRIRRVEPWRFRLPRYPIRADSPGVVSPILSGRVWLEEWGANLVRLASASPGGKQEQVAERPGDQRERE